MLEQHYDIVPFILSKCAFEQFGQAQRPDRMSDDGPRRIIAVDRDDIKSQQMLVDCMDGRTTCPAGQSGEFDIPPFPQSNKSKTRRNE